MKKEVIEKLRETAWNNNTQIVSILREDLRGLIELAQAAPPAAVPAPDDDSGLRVVKYIEKFDAGLTTAGFTHEQRMTIVGLLVDKAMAERAAAPAQAVDAPDAKFHIGAHVRKVKGSQWTGKIVGTYSTALTPEGYAVESSTEHGSVQIYPAAALELVEKKP